MKVVLALRASRGDRGALDGWIRELLATATSTGALQGSSVLTDADRSFILLRFASQEDRDRWRASADVEALMTRGAGFVAATEPIERTGLETWFALPGSPAAEAAPPQWKMALVTWCALVPQIIVLVKLIPPSVPFLANIAITTVIPVCVLTWVAMPALTRLLRPWLYPREASR